MDAMYFWSIFDEVSSKQARTVPTPINILTRHQMYPALFTPIRLTSPYPSPITYNNHGGLRPAPSLQEAQQQG